MLEERLAKLLARKLSGEATTVELQELNDWLQNNPADQYFADILLTYWNSYPDIITSSNSDSDQHFAHILEMAEESDEQLEPLAITERDNKKSLLLRRIKRIAIAASIAGFIMLATWMINRNTKREANPGAYTATENPQKEVLVGKGTRMKVELPDGTQVWLNSDSKLQYEETFNDEKREVTLEGEAYFDVVKDPKRPFIVHTSSIDVRVLGTAFNVKSYPQEPVIETTLIHGLIEVIDKKESKFTKFTVRPHQKLVIKKTDHAFEKASSADLVIRPVPSVLPGVELKTLPKNIPDTSLIETSWVYDKLAIDGDTFREMAVKMERWFNVKIGFKNEKVADLRIHYTFENESIEEAMKALQVIASFHYKIKNNNEVEISK